MVILCSLDSMFKKLNTNKRYLIAVSGGPDSMALLDMARNKLKYIEVGHVNYHKRDTAKRDENIVRRYCKKYGIKFHILNYVYENNSNNFQADARIARYKFFNKLCNKNNFDYCLVAHHKDDLIETYYMQVDKKLSVNYYGLANNINLYGVNVIRPLLKYTKNELIEYCEKHNIEYGIDESNNSDCYQRNRIRHSRVEKLSLKQKDELVRKINDINLKEQDKLRKVLLSFNKGEFSVSEFIRIPYLKKGLSVIFGGKSDKFFDEVIRQLKYASSYLYKGDTYWLSKEYQRIYVFKKPIEYKYVFNNIDELKIKKYECFKISKKGNSREVVTITNKDFPIVIRNCSNEDIIEMNFGSKKINRFFIDNKVLIKDRMSWPIVLNKKGSAILLPGLGCNIDHYSNNPNLCVIKL